jgi:hypothetical protein
MCLGAVVSLPADGTVVEPIPGAWVGGAFSVVEVLTDSDGSHLLCCRWCREGGATCFLMGMQILAGKFRVLAGPEVIIAFAHFSTSLKEELGCGS